MMTPHPYQNAYDTAITELNQIVQRFEHLRARKSQIEGLIQALQPFFGEPQAVLEGVPDSISTPAHAEIPQTAHMDAEPPEGYSFRDVPNPLPDISETGGDPFQRRAKANFRFRGLVAQRSY
jgi:hypothetical protein